MRWARPWRSALVIASCAPVSYTHLDVYKRQAWNVLSNLPFLLFGAWGVVALLRDPGLGAPLRPLHVMFFAAASLVSVGSAYYHADPTDATLVWDRLPMTLAFMAFFAAVIGRHVSPAFARGALVPLLLLGLSTVLWWRFDGDLRPYLLVQFVPVLTLPVVLLLFPVRTPGSRWLWWILVAYASAKGLETYDAQAVSYTHLDVYKRQTW